MKKNKFVESPNTLIPDIAVFVVMLTSICYAFLSFMELRPSLINIFFMTTFITLIAYLIYYSKKSILITSGSLFVYLLILIADFPSFLRPLYMPVSDFFSWLFDTLANGNIFNMYEYRNTFATFSILAFTVLYYLFIIKLRAFLTYSVFTISLFIYMNIAEYRISARKITITAFFFVVFALLYFYNANRYRIIAKSNEFIQNRINYGRWNKYIIPFISFILIFSIIIMPSDISRNLRNEALYKYIENLRNSVEDMFTQEQFGIKNKFDLNDTGFSMDAEKLGGPVTLNSKHVFDVKTKNNVYLRGAVFDKYTGHGWTNDIDVDGISFTSCSDLGYRDNFNFYDLNKYSGLNIFKSNQIRISNIHIDTSTIFSTPYTDNITFYKKIKLFYNQRSEIFTNRTIKDNNYLLRYYELDFESPNLKDIMGLDTVDFKQPTFYSDSAYVEKMNFIKQHYLQLPDNFPKSVRYLTSDITVGALNQYEKTILIRDFLKENYTYDLKPSAPPENIDFAENFLFQEKVGYCTYFATAMTVMCRSIGIPARYVTGFRVDVTDVNEDVVSVHNYDAHAWTEVYFPNLGWISFDPVGSADFQANRLWAENPNRTREPGGVIPSTPEPEPTPEPTEPAITPEQTTVPKETPNTTPTPTPASQSTFNLADYGIYFIILVCAVVLAGLIALSMHLLKSIKRNQPKALTAKERLYEIFQQNLSILNELNIHFDDGETLTAFFKKVDNYLHQLEEGIRPYIPSMAADTVKIDTLALIFEKGFYSDYELGPDEHEYISLFNKRISQDLEIVKKYLHEEE